MSRDRKPETFSEYKARRLELLREIDYHEQQVGYHKASAKAAEERLERLTEEFDRWERKSLEQQRIAQQETTEAVRKAHLAQENRLQELAERTSKRKAESLYQAMIKKFE